MRRLLSAAPTIAQENQLPGAPQSQWGINGAGDASIQGFATDISADQGETVRFKINDTALAPYHIDIYRIGFYQGLGARLVTTISSSLTLREEQPAPLRDDETGLVDCGNWSETASWLVPGTATSGVYIAKVIRDDTGGASHIPFIVRDDDGHSDVLYQTSDTTWQAYNNYGGNSLYEGNSQVAVGRAVAVSYNRPFVVAGDSRHSGAWFFESEYPMVRWLEANGYNVSYSTGVDTARRGAELLEHKAFFSVGHDEYWSAGQRLNVETARDAGVNLAFFGANDVFWKTRWDVGLDPSGNPYRTLVCYKETKANAKIDPSDVWTGTWRDPRFSPPSDGGRPENALTGTIFTVNGTRNDAMTVAAADGKMRFWRNTSVASLSPGATATFSGLLGDEWDEDLDNGYRPSGLFRMSSTMLTVTPMKLLDYGSTYGAGSATHSLTSYRAASGALVFSAGTIHWSWGLDSTHTNGFNVSVPAADPRIQQATVNLFADMGVQPATLKAGLVAAVASADHTAPSSVVAPPPSGWITKAGTPFTITGTAADTGGGVVGGVEVSIDGGLTWHRAEGRSSWSYSWVPALGAANVRSRAVDDTGNLETPGAGVTVTGAEDVAWTDVTIWPSTAEPAMLSSDTAAVELGVKFQSSESGYITGLRFYKGAANTGTHVGHLWDAVGNLLATATFIGETASGWQDASFRSPVAVTAGVTYVASYLAPNGGYAANPDYFANAGASSGPLTAPASVAQGGNGVFRYGAAGGFPSSSFRATNYWVDVAFSEVIPPDTKPPTMTATPAPGAVGVGPSTPVTAVFSEPLNPSSLSIVLRDSSGNLVPRSLNYDAGTQTATLDPVADLTPNTVYTVTLSGAADVAGNVMATKTWSFTTDAAITGATIWPDAATPGLPASTDNLAVELGVKFRASANGYITGVRFYKGAGNNGTHVGNLWSATGTLLATMTFADETEGGWQHAEFDTPVAVTGGQTYIASYYAPLGRYASDTGYFTNSGASSGPLTALKSGVDGGNGVFRYGAGGGFPATASTKGMNYWVDVLFSNFLAPDEMPPAIKSRSPLPGATGVIQGANVKVKFTEKVVASTISLVLRDASGNLVNGAVTYDAPARTVTFNPTGPLVANATYTATLEGAADAAGNVMSSESWTFTVGSPLIDATIWTAGSVPTLAASADTAAVEVGVKFRANADGYITGIRFYKGTGNTGTHVGHLWDATGALLATVTFADETAFGWQQANFNAPVAISAGQTYVASYYAPVGRYASDVGYFNALATTNGPLTALAVGSEGGNGVYRYGAGGGFPNATFNGTNYWVDVGYASTPDDLTAPVVKAVSPANGATLVSARTNITATFNEAVQADTISIVLRDSANNIVAAGVTYNPATKTVTLDPTADLTAGATYSVTVSGTKDVAGNAMTPLSWSFTVAPPITDASIWAGAATPSTVAAADTRAVEVGVKFRSSLDGYITGLRFYKGAGNTGTHVGHLWDTTGALLATVTFVNETAAGWQTAIFATPVQIVAGQTYVASYYAPVGRYATNNQYFSSGGTTNGALTALQSGVDGLNGVYRYGAGGGFPNTGSGSSANYWVDVLFSTSV